MKRVIPMFLVAVAAFAGPIVAPPEVKAQSSECVEGCEEDFDGRSIHEVALRGWCMIIRCILM